MPSLRPHHAPSQEPLHVSSPPQSQGVSSSPAAQRGAQFWASIGAITVCCLLSVLESTVISTALPEIVDELGGNSTYIWVITAYFLTVTSFQPLFCGLSEVFGRREPLLCAIGLFAIGSSISGGSQSIGMLIGGRAIQGLGAAGIMVLAQVLMCDLVPLRERSFFASIIQGTTLAGSGLGPVISGFVVESGRWRWVFFLCLPIAGVAAALLLAFLRVKKPAAAAPREAVRRADLPGNAAIVAACISCLDALSWAGTRHPWSSFRVYVPLGLGLLGFAAFFWYAARAADPIVPPRLFGNRTSCVAFILTLFHSCASMFLFFFMPIYFQGVLQSTPARSGLQVLPLALVVGLAALVGGRIVLITGQYIPVHLAGWAIAAIGFGILSLLDASSSAAEWVLFQVIVAAGMGSLSSALLPAAQACLSEDDAAKSSATLSFIRSFGYIWGSAISSTIFNSRVEQLLRRIQDAGVRGDLSNGQAYGHATRSYVMSLSDATGVRTQVVEVFCDSLKLLWRVGAGLGCFCFLLGFLEKRVELRTELNTRFRVDDVLQDEGSQESNERVEMGRTD